MPHVSTSVLSTSRRLLTLLMAVVVALAGVVLAPAAHADPPAEIYLDSPTTGNRQFGVSFGPYDSNSVPITATKFELSVTTSESSIVWRSYHLDANGSAYSGTVTTDSNGAALVNGTLYYVRLHAIDADGLVSPSTSFVTVVPGAPGAFSPAATSGDRTGSVSFSPPDGNGSPINGYELSVSSDPSQQTYGAKKQYTPGADGLITIPITRTSGGDPLSNGTLYFINIRASNSVAGTVGSTAFTPDVAPPTPTITSVVASTSTDPSVLGTGSATINFEAGVATGSSQPTVFMATANPGGLSSVDPCTDSQCVVPGLDNGTAYTFTITATNGSYQQQSTSAASAPAVTPQGAPYATTGLQRVSADPRSLTVSFVSPNSGGSPITAYEVSLDGGKTWRAVATRASGSRTRATVGGLQGSTRYSVLVRTRNKNGVSTPTGTVNILTGPAGVGRPTARAGTSAALVRWPANSGRDVVGYTVRSSQGASCTTATRTETACIIGSTAGVRTTYRVYARNATGYSFASAATNVVRASAPYAPKQVPGVPGGFSYHSTKVKSGKKATLAARGFLPGSSVVLVAYGSKRHIVKRFVVGSAGYFRAVVTMPKDKAKRLTFVAFGVTPYASSKAIGTSIKRR